MKAGGSGEKRERGKNDEGSANGWQCSRLFLFERMGVADCAVTRSAEGRETFGRPAAVDAVDAVDAEARAKTGRGPTAKLEPDHRASPPGLLGLA